jgi:hypothetical protein
MPHSVFFKVDVTHNLKSRTPRWESKNFSLGCMIRLRDHKLLTKSTTHHWKRRLLTENKATHWEAGFLIGSGTSILGAQLLLTLGAQTQCGDRKLLRESTDSSLRLQTPQRERKTPHWEQRFLIVPRRVFFTALQ